MKVGEGRACYTFGELLQGQIGGHPMLVSLAVKSYVHAVFYPSSSAELLTPSTKVKAREAINQLMRDYKMDSGGMLFIESPLPEGKGFATSTADMIAACRAVASIHNLRISPRYLSSLIAKVEPTDGTMYEEAVAYRHRQGRLLARLGYLPPMKVIGIDRGGHVDTLLYNEQLAAYTPTEEKEYSRLLKQLQKAVVAGDCRGIGAVATQSAILHEQRLSNPFLPAMLELMEETEAAGVVTAHSGTVSGIIVDMRSPYYETQASYILNKMAGWGCEVYTFDTISRAERREENDTAISDTQRVYSAHLAGLVDHTR